MIIFYLFITQPCICFANKITPGVSEGIFLLLSFQVFEKKGVETPKNSVFGYFCKIVELNTNVLETSLLSEINN